MPKQFFSGWEAWEKLVFILACAIVVTVILGCAKLLHAHLRLRRYSAIAEQDRQENAMQRQMSQRRRASVAGRGDDVPFGIRALERGHEVDGIWNSRSNTPELPKSKGTYAASSTWDQVPSKDSDVDLEMQTSRTKLGSNSTTAIAGPTEESLLDHTTPAEKPPSSQMSQDSSSGALITKPGRPKYPPLSFDRYCRNTYMLRRPSNTTMTLQALESIYKASTSIRGEDTGSSESSNQSSNTTDDSGPISSSAPYLLSSQPRPRPRQQSSSDLDLELLNRHRTSQVAETGQLARRGRPPSQSLSMELSEFARIRRDSASRDRSNSFLPDGLFLQLQPASPPLGNAFPSSPYSSHKIDALPAAVRRSSMPDVTPFTEFCKRTSQGALPENLRSRSRESTQPSSPKSPDSVPQSPPPSTTSSPIIPASEGAAEMKLPMYITPFASMPPIPAPSKESFEHRTSQVIRGRGTGFEILGGSRNPQDLQEHHLESLEVAPSGSMQHFTASRRSSTCSIESRTWRKLHKKKQPSFGSEGSGSSKRFSLINLFT